MILNALRARQPGAPLWRVFWWHFLHGLCWVYFAPFYHYRAWGIHNIPDHGPVLLLSNHQSFFDPILVGLGGHKRQFFAMARSTLFRHPAFSWLIRSLNAIPVERGESDIAAMRRCIDMLKRDQALLIFPEGTRSRDGTTGRFATGTMLLIKRAQPMVVPVAIEGAFDIWPRWRKAPFARGRVGVMYGPPIDAKTLIALPAEQALAQLQQSVETMRLEVARRLKRLHRR